MIRTGSEKRPELCLQRVAWITVAVILATILQYRNQDAMLSMDGLMRPHDRKRMIWCRELSIIVLGERQLGFDKDTNPASLSKGRDSSGIPHHIHD